MNATGTLAIAFKVTEFWNLVDRGSPNECWLWTGCLDKDGYGQFAFGGGKWGAHELALSFTTGEFKHSSLDTCHSCHNPTCCNPHHLRFDTRRSNIQDMDDAGRRVVGTAKLTAEDIITIRERRASGAAQQDLAEQFGISDGQVSMIVRGLRWPDIGGPIQTERKYYRVG